MESAVAAANKECGWRPAPRQEPLYCELRYSEKTPRFLVQPDRHPFARISELQVRIFVIDNGEWMLFLFGIKPEEDVVTVLGPQEIAGQIQLALRQISGWLECLKRLAILRPEYKDRSAGSTFALGNKVWNTQRMRSS